MFVVCVRNLLKSTDNPDHSGQVSNAASPEGRRGAGVGLYFAAGAVEMRETQHLKQDGGLSSVALVCANAQQVLGRKLSSGVAPAALGVDSTAAGVVRERSGPEFTASAVTLRPGVNQVRSIFHSMINQTLITRQNNQTNTYTYLQA